MSNHNNGEEKRRVGIVIGTKDSTPFEFWFQVDDDVIVNVDNIVKVINRLKDGDREVEITFYGVVSNILKGFEGVDFHSWNKETLSGIIPYQTYQIAHVRITRIEPETYLIPPDPKSEVFIVLEEEDTKKAINIDKKEELLPAGILSNGKPAYINWDFINGRKGAHISISGISGVATKTSYALFLIHSMLYSNKLKTAERDNIKVVIFSVKGEDLLHLDKPNTRISNEDKKLYEMMWIPPKPFRREDIEFWTPPDPSNPKKPLTHERSDADTKIYSWSIKDLFREGLVEYMFDQDDRQDDNFSYALNSFTRKIKDMIEESPEDVIEIRDKQGKPIATITSLYSNENETNGRSNSRIRKMSLSKFLEMVSVEGDYENIRRYIFGSSTSQTVLKFARKFSECAKSISFMVGNRTREISFEKKVNVISIPDKFLSPIAQRFVVGSILSNIYQRVSSTSSNNRNYQLSGSKIFIMLDELNKYAPAYGFSPIKNILLDISERGRSLGIILIGAQQMSSEVEPRIISNSSIRVNGRLDAREVEHSLYSYLPKEFKEKSKKIRSGTMILFQPDVEVPLVITFPHPPYATRKEEAKSEKEKLVKIDRELI
ncbi:MAG: ATP-binding protein [Spirochaetia bacterium]|nr:ATP-binding protein [Spirochaetota bacterium]MDW8112111.1 ATP-binding protein [Spirochaetia bacterium]